MSIIFYSMMSCPFCVKAQKLLQNEIENGEIIVKDAKDCKSGATGFPHFESASDKTKTHTGLPKSKDFLYKKLEIVTEKYGQPMKSHGHPMQPHGQPPHGQPMKSHGHPMKSHGHPMQPHGHPMQPHGHPMQPHGHPPHGHHVMSKPLPKRRPLPPPAPVHHLMPKPGVQPPNPPMFAFPAPPPKYAPYPLRPRLERVTWYEAGVL